MFCTPSPSFHHLDVTVFMTPGWEYDCLLIIQYVFSDVMVLVCGWLVLLI